MEKKTLKSSGSAFQCSDSFERYKEAMTSYIYQLIIVKQNVSKLGLGTAACFRYISEICF